MELVTLQQTNDNPLIKGIIKEIYGKNALSWLTNDLANELNIEYYFNHSNDKYISPLFYNLMVLQEKGSIESYLSLLADILISKYKNTWDRLYNAYITATYNPIENYSMTEIDTPDLITESNSKTKTKLNTNVKTKNETYGFNSTDSVPTNDNESDTMITGEQDDNATNTSVSQTGTRTLTRSGNIGVTTSQQMLESEIELRKWNFYNSIFNDIDSVLCLKIY